jgi:glycosyltransferase involved in cell wall biosynthesis
MISSVMARSLAGTIDRPLDAPIDVAFVGALIPDATVDRYPALSAAGMMFQARMLSNLTEQGVVTSHIFSVRPVPNFPRMRRLWFGPERQRTDWGAQVDLLPCINLGPIKTLVLSLALFPALIRWGWRHRRSDARAILLYNVASPPAVVSLAAGWVTRTPVFATVADLEVPGSGHRRRTLLRRLEYWLQTKSLQHFDGLIVVTRAMAHDFVRHNRWIHVEGAIPEDVADRFTSPSTNPPAGGDEAVVFMYSGGLTTLKGIPLLLDAFALIDNPNVRLWITGRGDCEALIHERAERDRRIRYWGFLDYEKVLDLYRCAAVLVNPHLTQPLSARYVFPSKLLEYLVTGKPVVTLATPDIEEEYADVVVVAADQTPTALASAMTRTAAMPVPAREALGQRARQKILATKTWSVQAARIADFMRDRLVRRVGG